MYDIRADDGFAKTFDNHYNEYQLSLCDRDRMKSKALYMKRLRTKTFIYTLIALLLFIATAPADVMAADTTAAETTAAETTTAYVPVSGISLDTKSAMLKAGKHLSLKADVEPEDASNKAIDWKSSDENVATVSKDGKVSAKGYGTATITATTKDGGFSASCEIKVLFFDLGDDTEGFYEALYWAVDQNIVAPESRSMFLPKSMCSRESVISYLYNLMEKPKYKTGTSFKDVKKDSPFYDAVSWAEENGLLKDIATKNKFSGGKTCLKEELATLLYRLKESPYVGYDGLFTDVESDSFYKDAVNWAVENNVIDDYRDEDGSSSYHFGSGDKLTKEDVSIFLYNYTHESNPGFAEEFYFSYSLPVLMNGSEVSEELYAKYTDPQYCAEAFAYYALEEGWQYEAVVGALAYMWAEGMGAHGTFTYEGCWSVRGPSGNVYDRTLDNSAWREWVHSADCCIQMISHSSYYSNSHFAVGLGYCGESNAWNMSGGRWKQMVYNADAFLTAADMSGVAWQDITFQTKRALYTITACSYDPDWRNPKTFTGDAREYCARVFSTVGYTAFPVWYDNGQLGAHLDKVETVRPFVDAVINNTSMITEDLSINALLY